jgi:hypothetical protein
MDRVANAHGSVEATDQWCLSDEVMELLLAFAALTVGAKHKQLSPAAAASRASSSSSRRRGRGSSTATAAGGVPASHAALLTAVSPAPEQTHREYRHNSSASGFGSFSSCGDSLLHRDLLAALNGLAAVLTRRDELLTQLLQGSRAAGSAAAAAVTPGGSSSSSSSDYGVRTVVPRELQLLLPLLLTVIEAMLLLPQRSHNIIP